MWSFIRFAYNVLLQVRKGMAYEALIEANLATKELKWAEYKGFSRIYKRELLNKYIGKQTIRYSKKGIKEMFENKFGADLERLMRLRAHYTFDKILLRRMKNLMFSQLPSEIKNVYWYAADGVFDNLFYNYIRWPLLEGWKPAILRNAESFIHKRHRDLKNLEKEEEMLCYKWNKTIMLMSMSNKYTNDKEAHANNANFQFQNKAQAMWNPCELEVIQRKWVDTNKKVLILKRELTIEEQEQEIMYKYLQWYDNYLENEPIRNNKRLVKLLNDSMKKQKADINKKLVKLNKKEIKKIKEKLTNLHTSNKTKIANIILLESIDYKNYIVRFYPRSTGTGIHFNKKRTKGWKNFDRRYATYDGSTEILEYYIRSEMKPTIGKNLGPYMTTMNFFGCIDCLATMSFGRHFNQVLRNL